MSDNLLYYYGDNPDVLWRHVKDEWRWDPGAPGPKAFHETVAAGGRVAEALVAVSWGKFLGHNPGAPGLAYVANIAPRLVEVRRVLKPTGSLYLHCNPTASDFNGGIGDSPNVLLRVRS